MCFRNSMNTQNPKLVEQIYSLESLNKIAAEEWLISIHTHCCLHIKEKFHEHKITKFNFVNKNIAEES